MSDEFDRRLDEAIARLPRAREPGVDLWPAIEARLDRRGRRWAVPAAMAAALAAGLSLAVWLAAPGPEAGRDPLSQRNAVVAAAGSGRALARQAALVDRSYRAALLAAGSERLRLSPAERRALNAELAALDDAQQRIRAAMESQPRGDYLLSLLVQTHALRLDVITRLAGGPAASGGSDENGNV